MSTLRQAAQQALETLQFYYDLHGDEPDAKAILALRAALAEPEQEPVGYWDGEFSTDGGATLYEVPQVSFFGRKYPNIPVYAEPTPRKPQTTHWEGCEAVHPECRKPEPVVQLEFKGTLPISRGGYAPTPQPEQEPVLEVRCFGEKRVFVTLVPVEQLKDGEKLYRSLSQEKPVGYFRLEQGIWYQYHEDDAHPETLTPLYTASTPRKPLTDEEIDELSRTMIKGDKSVNWLCRAIERKHGIGEQV